MGIGGHRQGLSKIPVLGSAAVDEGRPCPTLQRVWRTVLPAWLTLPVLLFPQQVLTSALPIPAPNLISLPILGSGAGITVF